MVLSVIVVIATVVALRFVPRTFAGVFGTLALLVGLATAILGVVVAIENCHLPTDEWGVANFDLHRMGALGWAVVGGCLVTGLAQVGFGIVLATRDYAGRTKQPLP